MGMETFNLTTFLPVERELIFDAWLSSDGHSWMTGGAAEVSDARGGSFTAWDGYITGVNLELERPRWIKQAWRTSEFPPESQDSILEITLESDAGGTRLSLTHREIPEGQSEAYRAGWEEHYFDPMKKYFKGLR